MGLSVSFLISIINISDGPKVFTKPVNLSRTGTLSHTPMLSINFCTSSSTLYAQPQEPRHPYLSDCGARHVDKYKHKDKQEVGIRELSPALARWGGNETHKACLNPEQDPVSLPQRPVSSQVRSLCPSDGTVSRQWPIQ